MQHETANVVLPAESELLQAHLRARQREGVRMNVNFLGEALLGEEEARRRLHSYVEALFSGDIECLSVKISTIDSQISAVARAHTVATLCDRLENPLSHGGQGHLRSRRQTRPEVHLPGHGGVSRHAPHGRGVHADAGAAGHGKDQRRHRPAGLRARLRAGIARIAKLGTPANRAGRQPDHRANREGRQHGNGARRGVAAWMAPGDVQDQGRDGRELQKDAHRVDHAGESRSGADRRRFAQSLRSGLWARSRGVGECRGPRAIRNARRHGESSTSRPFRALAQSPALRAGLPERRLSPRHRVPHPAARRKHRTRQFSAARFQIARWQPGVGDAGTRISRSLPPRDF